MNLLTRKLRQWERQCPKCGGIATCDSVDIGVGEIQSGPYSCEECGWTDEDEESGSPMDEALEATATATLRARAEQAEARIQELLALVAKLSRETPYPEEAEENRQRVGVLTAEVGTLRSRAEQAERERDEAKELVKRDCTMEERAWAAESRAEAAERQLEFEQKAHDQTRDYMKGELREVENERDTAIGCAEVMQARAEAAERALEGAHTIYEVGDLVPAIPRRQGGAVSSRKTIFRAERDPGQSRHIVCEYPCPDGLGNTHGTTRKKAVAEARRENDERRARLRRDIAMTKAELKRLEREHKRVRVVLLGEANGPCVVEWDE